MGFPPCPASQMTTSFQSLGWTYSGPTAKKGASNSIVVGPDVSHLEELGGHSAAVQTMSQMLVAFDGCRDICLLQGKLILW